MKVLIATPSHNGSVTTVWFESLMQSIGALSEHQFGVLTVLGDLISRARNSCAEFMLEHDFDKLMFIDSDISWTPAHLKSILQSHNKIVGGTYPYKRYPIGMILNVLDEHSKSFKIQEVKTREEYKAFAEKYRALNGEVEVKHLPTGFLCIDREVLVKLSDVTPAYFGYDVPTKTEKHIHDFFPMGIVDHKYETEDWGFCRLARKYGYKIMLQTNCVVDHSGDHTYSFWRGQ